MKVINEQRTNSLLITDSCEFDECHLFAEKLRLLTGIDYKPQVDENDCMHLSYRFKGTSMTLYYNIYTGISVHPEDADDELMVTDDELTDPLDLDEEQGDINILS